MSYVTPKFPNCFRDINFQPMLLITESIKALKTSISYAFRKLWCKVMPHTRATFSFWMLFFFELFGKIMTAFLNKLKSIRWTFLDSRLSIFFNPYRPRLLSLWLDFHKNGINSRNWRTSRYIPNKKRSDFWHSYTHW